MPRLPGKMLLSAPKDLGRPRISWCRGEMDVFERHDINRKLDARTDVVGLKIWIVIPDDVIKRQSFADEFQDALHRNPRAYDTRLAKVNPGIDADAIGHG